MLPDCDIKLGDYILVLFNGHHKRSEYGKVLKVTEITKDRVNNWESPSSYIKVPKNITRDQIAMLLSINALNWV